MTGKILQMSNKEGERVYREDWKEICAVELKAYFGILFLAGVYKSGVEATGELQHVSHFTRTFLSFDRSQCSLPLASDFNADRVLLLTFITRWRCVG
jgi:hypothetical protein